MRRPGRPPLDEKDPSVKLTITMPSKQMINLCTQAQQERRTLQELVRHILATQQKNTLK